MPDNRPSYEGLWVLNHVGKGESILRPYPTDLWGNNRMLLSSFSVVGLVILTIHRILNLFLDYFYLDRRGNRKLPQDRYNGEGHAEMPS
jgi:hypothetical protein